MRELKKALWKKGLAGYFIWGLLLAIAGGFVFMIGALDLIQYCTAKNSVWEYPAWRLAEDDWYVVDNNYLLDQFWEDEHGCYYITATSENEFLGYYVPKKFKATADDIVDACWEYIDGNAEDWPELYMTGKGHVENMKYEEKVYFKSWFEYAGADEETIANLNYKTIHVDTLGTLLSGEDHVPFLILGGIMALIGIWLIVLFLINQPTRSLYKQLKRDNVSEYALDQDMTNAQRVGNVWMGSRFLVSVGVWPHLITYEKLVWVYKEQTTTRYRAYGVIPMGKSVSYGVAFVDDANAKLVVPMKKAALTQVVVDYIHGKAPYIICGYSEELERLRASGFQAMYARVQEEKNRLIGNTDFMNNAYTMGNTNTMDNNGSDWQG